MGHNSKKMFRRFSELQKGNEIKVTTSYGEYTYKIYDMKLIKETELDQLPIQRDKEILIHVIHLTMLDMQHKDMLYMQNLKNSWYTWTYEESKIANNR